MTEEELYENVNKMLENQKNSYPNNVSGAFTASYFSTSAVENKYGKKFFKKYKKWAMWDAKVTSIDNIPGEYYDLKGSHIKKFLLEKL